MGGSPISGVSHTPLFIIFTDLDGTLLDHNTYRWEEALPALTLCRKLQVPVVLASSKTRAEMDLLRRKLSVSAPFISENGGGIFFPMEVCEAPPRGASLCGGLWRWSLGTPYTRLVSALQEIRAELGCNIKGFSDMGTQEISQRTGLDEGTSRLAAMREYDEPFIIVGKPHPDTNVLSAAAARRGLTISAGGRFYHLQGKNDKGHAMEKLISWYRLSHAEVVSIALGDSPNDVPMLERADHPFLIGSSPDFHLSKKRIPLLRVTRERGPKGWNEAILDILGEKEEEGNA
jgi:mannosyl-3-phosphoglycerate phosphatase